MKITTNTLLALAIMTATTPAFSQDEAPLDALMKQEKLEAELKWLHDENIVVTASRTPEHINKTAATVTVITDAEIRNMGARTLMDILSIVPGFGVTSDNQHYTSQFRGLQARSKILIMVNSHPLNTPADGDAFKMASNLIVENIKRVEIIRGPGSAIYGANAFLAVVNVITKEAADVDGAEISAGGGSYGTQQYNMMFGKKINDLDIYANLNFLDTDGYKGFVPQDMQTTFDNIFGTHASLAPGYTNARQQKYDLDFGAKYKDFAFKGRYFKDTIGTFAGAALALDEKGFEKFELLTMELAYSHAITSNLDFSTKVYNYYFDSSGFYILFPPGYTNPGGAYPEGMFGTGGAKETKLGAETQFIWEQTTSNKVVFGAMVENQKQFDVSQSLNFNPFTGAPLGSFQDVSSWANWSKNVSRDILAVYVEDLFDIRDNLRLTAGARYDRYSDFGGTFNPRAGLAWEFSKGQNFKLTYGSAFRAPAFNDMYVMGNPVIAGNPNLKPENINTIEASLGSEFTKSTSSRITLFHSNIDNYIGRSAPDSTGLAHFENYGSVTSKGVELELKTKFAGGSYLSMNYTYQDPKDSVTGRVADVPSQRVNVVANWQINRQFNLNSQLFLKGSTPRAQGDTRGEVPGYGLVNTTLIAQNLSGRWDGLELQLSLYNLFDRKYVDPAPANTLPADYPKPGRSFFAEARYKFD